MNSDETVKAVFSLAVSLLVLGVVLSALSGGDVSGFVSAASGLAVPFVYGLIGLFLVLQLFDYARHGA